LKNRSKDKYIILVHLRRICRRKNGKAHYYWALVESYRTERGPRNRIVSYLGELDEAGRLGLLLAAERSSEYQASLLTNTQPEWVEVDVRQVHTERSRRFGDAWLALELLKKLGLPDLFNRLMPSDHAKIPWGILATVLVIARFCDPGSELHVAEQSYRATALPDLIGIPEEAIYDNRLYRALDQLVKRKDDLQRHLKDRMGELFQIRYDLLLYDVTSTYFEGQASDNRQARRGYSRDHRPDCKQVCLGLVVTREGIPLGYEVFEGNRHDSQTLSVIVEKMEALYGKSDRVWIMDRGMVSPENLELLGRDGRRYILGMPKCQLKRFEKDLLVGDWQHVHDGLEAKLCASPEGNREVFILCRSAARREKDRSIHARFRDRIEAELRKLQRGCASGRIKSVNTAERRIGRILERNQRAAALFAIEVRERDGSVTVTWTARDALSDWEKLSEGCYLLRSNILDWTAEELWEAYIHLTDAEEAFRIQKDDLNLRPIWHRREDRVQAHIFVCFLTYVLWKCLAQWCKQSGLGNEPRKMVEEIRKITLTDVVLPTRNGIAIRLHCVSKPSPDLAFLLGRLRLNLPARMNGNRFL
jgi:transposase